MLWWRTELAAALQEVTAMLGGSVGSIMGYNLGELRSMW